MDSFLINSNGADLSLVSWLCQRNCASGETPREAADGQGGLSICVCRG